MANLKVLVSMLYTSFLPPATDQSKSHAKLDNKEVGKYNFLAKKGQ